MNKLRAYLMEHANRGSCQCGRCIDAPATPEQPAGHTADMAFFKVSANNTADAETLRALIRENKQGEFCDVDLFDGKEHGFIELGGWLGDQGDALVLMGLGAVLGLWKLLTPQSMLGDSIPKDLQMQMAQQGFVTIRAEVKP